VRARTRLESDLVMLLLSFKAGLRAQEIALLTWASVTTSSGELASAIHVSHGVTKKGLQRTIPMHERLREALVALRITTPTAVPDATILVNRHGVPYTPNDVAVRLRRVLVAAGFHGCSSHSGRRTFLTALTRTALQGRSLKDVMVITGHRHLTALEAYLEPSPDESPMILALK
jgi:integrase/recombinase XerC